MGDPTGITAVIGTIGGTITAISAIDDVIGSPLKRSLGLMPQGVVADFSGQDINKGLYNYLRKLQDIAPTYIDRNKTAVAKGYVKAYRAEEKGVKSMQRYTKVKPKEPVYVPTNYGKGESE